MKIKLNREQIVKCLNEEVIYQNDLNPFFKDGCDLYLMSEFPEEKTQ